MEVEATKETTSAAPRVAEIIKNAKFINKSTAAREVKFTTRALKGFTSLRHSLTAEDLSAARARILPQSGICPDIDVIFPLSTTSSSTSSPTSSTSVNVSGALAYLHLLVGVWLIDQGRPAEAASLLSGVGARVIKQVDITSIDPLIAKIFYFCALAHEKKEKAASAPSHNYVTDDVMSNSDFRSKMFSAYNHAGLRRLAETRFTVLNVLLRSYVESSLYEQADRLVSKSGFTSENDDSDVSIASSTDDVTLSSGQYARYYYYVGRIRSVQLDYSGAYDALQHALRKAPEGATSAAAFKVAVAKLLCIVQLLMGEIPERSAFSQPGTRSALKPYLLLAQAVRGGSVRGFHDVVTSHNDVFARDGTLGLVARLRHNVIKAGLRKICAAYSRISLKDVAERLHIVPAEDCEFIVAKAIRDDVIDGVIDHEGGWLATRDTVDVYATQDPRAAYDKRIRFCFQMHSLAKNSMVFAADAHRPKPPQMKVLLDEEADGNGGVPADGFGDDGDDDDLDFYDDDDYEF